MLDHLRQIAIFAKTAELGSFKKAADVLQLSPSVVSHHISMLEKQLNVALLYRSTRKLSLTSDGEKLLASAQMIVQGAESFIGAVSSQSPALIGQLKVTLPAILPDSYLLNRISQFGLMHPSVRLDLDFTDTPRDIIQDGIDLAIRMGSPKDSALKARKLYTFDRVVVGATRYLDSKPEPTSPHELNDWEWIELSPVGLHHRFHNGKGDHVTLQTKAQIAVNSAYAMYRLVISGNGLGALPRFVVQESIDKGEIRTVLDDWQLNSIDTYAVWPGNAPKEGLTKRFVDFLAEPTNEK